MHKNTATVRFVDSARTVRKPQKPLITRVASTGFSIVGQFRRCQFSPENSRQINLLEHENLASARVIPALAIGGSECKTLVLVDAAPISQLGSQSDQHRESHYDHGAIFNERHDRHGQIKNRP